MTPADLERVVREAMGKHYGVTFNRESSRSGEHMSIARAVALAVLYEGTQAGCDDRCEAQNSYNAWCQCHRRWLYDQIKALEL